MTLQKTEKLNIDLTSFESADVLSEYLSVSVSSGMMDADTAGHYIYLKKEQMVTDTHPYAISQGQGKDKRWFTYVIDPKSGKRKKVGKRSYDDLICSLYDHYFPPKDELLLPVVYKEWIRYRMETVNRMQTVRRNDSDYRRFYVNEPLSEKIMTTPLNKLTRNDLTSWASGMIRKHKMTRKAYGNMSLIIRQIYIYLVNEGLLTENTFARVSVPSAAFRKERKKPADTQIFYPDEKERILERAEERAEETQDENYLAIALTFYTGVRLGECLGLTFADFDKNKGIVHVERSMARIEHRNDDGTWDPSRYEVQDYLKQNADPRDVIIPEKTFDIVRKIRIIKQKKGSTSPFLFDVKTPNNIEMKLYRICKELDISERSPHKIRKTYVSELLNNQIDADFVREQAGHRELRTTLNSYDYSTTRNDEMIDKLDRAL